MCGGGRSPTYLAIVNCRENVIICNQAPSTDHLKITLACILLQEINKIAMTSTTLNSSADNIYPFSSTSLIDLLQEFSEVSTVRVALGYALMVTSIPFLKNSVLKEECFSRTFVNRSEHSVGGPSHTTLKPLRNVNVPVQEDE